jgi:hypothetical protein
MQAAADVALQYGVPVVLGDQDIADTKKRMGQAFKESLMDMVNPFSAGWSRLYYDLKEVTLFSLGRYCHRYYSNYFACFLLCLTT